MHKQLNLIKIIILTSFCLCRANLSFAEPGDISGIWSEPSRAILYDIKTINHQPKVVTVYTKNNEYCIADKANTESMKDKFIRASRVDVTGDTMKFYELPIDYPYKVKNLIKLNQLPVNCLTTLKSDDPKTNFDVLWSFFNSYYPSFKERLSSVNLSWRDLYNKYSKHITPQMSRPELFKLMGNMLEELHDQHIDVYFEGNPDDGLDINNDNRKDVIEFNNAFAQSYGIDLDSDAYVDTLGKSIINSFNTIDTRYLEHAYHGTESSLESRGFPAQPVYTWGMIKNSNIGYLRILQELHFTNDSMTEKINQYHRATKTIDQLMKFFREKNIKKLIIDNRINFGGEGSINDYLIQYLITDKRIVSQTQEIIDETPQNIRYFYLQPNEHPLRTKQNEFPVIVLTSNETVSAGEDLTLALKALDNVTQIGYTTNGVFASTHTRTLPNSWIFQLPFDRNMSHDGKYYEGIGIPPDVAYHPANNYLMKHYNENQQDIFLDGILTGQQRH